MFGFLKKLGRRRERPEAATSALSSHDTEIIPALAHAPVAGSLHAQRPLAARPIARGVQVPLQPVLAGLPLELQPRLIHPEVGQLSTAIPLHKTTAQLSPGPFII